jgi:hypothetical protein
MSSKMSYYSNICKYDSQAPINPIENPYITSGVPLIFSKVGKIPPIINEISDEKLKEVKYYSNQYQSNLKAYGSQ